MVAASYCAIVIFMKVESQGVYRFVVVPGHPMADNRGRVLEHRYVMSEHLGRPLTADEVVHHKNENPLDNRVENLELMSNSDHNSLHRPPSFRELQCSLCNKPIVRQSWEIRSESVFCSRECQRSFSLALGRGKLRNDNHGSSGKYRRGCRCDVCRKANAARCAVYRKTKKQIDERPLIL